MRISTSAFVKGSRDTVIHMLNRAFHSLGSEEIIINSDDTIAAINRKIRQANTILEGYHAEFTLLSFLDDENRMESPYEDYVLSYIDEPEPDGSENYGVDLVDVKKHKTGYSLRIHSCRNDNQEGYLREDWQDWCERMVRLYGCRIVTTEKRYGDTPDDGKPVQYSCFYELDEINHLKKATNKENETEGDVPC